MNWRKRHRVLRVAVALVVVTILTVAFLPQLALAISQSWYLTDTASATEYVMNRGTAGGSSVPVTVALSASEIWVADEPAFLPVTFPSGNWTGQITATPGANTHDATVEIGSWNGSTFTSAGTSGTMTFPTKNQVSTQPFTITGASAINISVGNWLALRFNNTDISKTIAVATDGTSYVDSPSTDPGYPSPWESYDNASQSNVWGTGANPYTSATQTAYMYGTGFVPSNYYDIYYYDGNNNLVTAANHLNVQATIAGNLESAYLLTTDPGAAQGWWNCGVLDNPSTPPSTWQTTGWVAYDSDSFYVDQSAIPEFPTAFAAMAVCALCAAGYLLMRKKVAHAKA